MKDIDTGDGVEWDGNVEVEVAGFWVVDSQTIDEDERLLEGSATNGEIGLNAFGGAGLHIERWIGAEEIDGRVGEGGRVARRDDLYGAVAFGEW